MNKKTLLFVVVLLGLFVAAFGLTKQPKKFSQYKLNLIKQDLNKIGTVFKHARKVVREKNLGDMSIECGICGIVVNEIEGFVRENKTLETIESLLQLGVCNEVTGFYQVICNEAIADLPSIIDSIEAKNTVSVVCVDRGYCQKPFETYTDPQPIPEVIVNLDLPPAQRLPTICNNPTFQNVSQYLVGMAAQLLPRIHPYLEDLGQFINRNYFPIEYAQEIQGCASTLGISEGWLAMFNIGYEISDACTSIVAQTPDGKILHARNLDFWDGMGFTDSLKEMAIVIDYQTKGQTVFKATGFAGYVGVLSGFKAHAFSATVDTRFYPDGIGDFFYEVIAAITEKNASLVTFLMRKTFTNENDFASALNNLSNDELIADVYYILAGVAPFEGAVISRNRHNASDVWTLDQGRWFEVQTNYDHWEAPPWFDDRVTPADNGMNAIGQANISLDNMFQVLTTKPVFNLQTTYTFLSCPAEGYTKSFTRYCPFPCVE